MTPRTQALIGLCLGIAALDLAQPLLLPWVPKHVGAIAGGLLYLAFAAGIRARVAAVEWAVAAMPVLPLTVLALWGAGVPLPVTPDGPMVAILALQLTAAAVALANRLQ